MSSSRDEGTAVRKRTLDSLVRCVDRLHATRRRDIRPGDFIVVSTKNSVYRLQALADGLFHASGGWFERNAAPRTVSVNGCTFGGSTICTDIVAAKGLFLEFGNKVSTTRIRSVRVLRPTRCPDEAPD